MLDNLVWFILLVVLALFSLTVPSYFQIGIFANIVEQSTFVGTLAIGLSSSSSPATWTSRSKSVMALAAMVDRHPVRCTPASASASRSRRNGWSCRSRSLVALAVGAAVGATNGFFVVRLKMNAFIVTLAAYIWVRGLVVALSGGRSAQDLPPRCASSRIERFLAVPLHRLDLDRLLRSSSPSSCAGRRSAAICC